MPSFNPFASAGSRHCSLFEIRLDSDFIVFRGNEHEASGQLLKGVVVLCLKEHLKVEDIHLRLTGHCRIAWLDGKQTPSGIHNQKVDRTTAILKHNWTPFVGETNHHNTLAPGNYEWPFEIMLAGDTPESVEGLYQTGITYLFKATVSRGKLAKNLHAYKRLRIVRTLEPAALELNHAMSVENVWPNKIEYSVGIPQKAVVFGSSVPLQMRFTPLLKGLEIGNIKVKMFEAQELSASGQGHPLRTHKHDREVANWDLEVSHTTHWHDMIEETGQEGWVVNQELPLPKKLNQCIQDCTVQGIKIRHKLRLTVALNNPDGHVSELRATLPVNIFISPNMPIDEDGNLVPQSPSAPAEILDEHRNMAPPGYGQHVLDQLYEDVDISGILTPGVQSGLSTPFYGHSRAGSSENLAATANGAAVPPAALSHRLQSMTLDEVPRGRLHHASHDSRTGAVTPHDLHDHEHAADLLLPHSPVLSRRTSEEEHSGRSGHGTPPIHNEFPPVEQLSKVPSYSTAKRAPLPRTVSFTDSLELPDYNTAMSAPGSPTQVVTDPMETITEDRRRETPSAASPGRSRSSSSESRGNHVLGFSFFPSHTAVGGHDGGRLLGLLQHRGA
ncbi:putative carbon catabolite repression protein [Rosellinia necatrix]|uniref:Putative carbon catabolite repression protein n=1 Tax=Rosellinia necatrix TaxID=77044 RepID=A0A1W2TS10_ROSNE|nr:putative carbon catabolite repression protein [Rosellinia necatrix]